MKKIGLLAGVGRLPVEFARAARGMGYAVTGIAVVPGFDPDLPAAVDSFYEIGAGCLEKIDRSALSRTTRNNAHRDSRRAPLSARLQCAIIFHSHARE